MLRVHFTAEDLARVTVATRLDPLWETMLGVQQLAYSGQVMPAMQGWRRRARRVVGQGGPLGSLRMLGALLPARGYFPDFLTPTAAEEGLDVGLEAIRGTPPRRLRDELVQLTDSGPARRRSAPVWMRNLAGGDRDRMADLTGAIRTVHDSVIVPEWTEAEARVEETAPGVPGPCGTPECTGCSVPSARSCGGNRPCCTWTTPSTAT
ncbi:hypothetical protein ACFYZ5_37600 [Streptomyces chartreusis]|uniref:hypothetical protein n=1 Tax=Streptomyces chartreusis TaxID=1969 RepID=UPI0036ACD03C